MKLLLAVFFLFLPIQDDLEGWKLFSRVAFEAKYFPEYKETFLVPRFNQEIIRKSGSLLVLRGHYLPLDLQGNSIIISKYPYAACFFCGGAGPESVAEIFFSVKPPKLKPDQVITVRGKLRLNKSDVNHMNFILDDAELL